MLLLSQRTFQRPRNDSSTPTSDQHHSSFSGALPRSQCQEEEVNCFRFPSFPDMVQSASKTPENDQLTVCLWRSRLEGPFSAVSTKKKSKTQTHTYTSKSNTPRKGRAITHINTTRRRAAYYYLLDFSSCSYLLAGYTVFTIRIQDHTTRRDISVREFQSLTFVHFS